VPKPLGPISVALALLFGAGEYIGGERLRADSALLRSSLAFATERGGSFCPDIVFCFEFGTHPKQGDVQYKKGKINTISKLLIESLLEAMFSRQMTAILEHLAAKMTLRTYVA
jgi:hypothetical protein